MASATQRTETGESRDRDVDRAVTEAIAKETGTPPEIVQEIYEQTLSDLASDAKITQYLGVLTSRRVRMILRRH
jgi:uncharacterized protein (DUF2126 family)